MGGGEGETSGLQFCRCCFEGGGEVDYAETEGEIF